MTRLWEPHAYSDAPRADCAWALEQDWPALDGDAETDVAVIGGGYTGLSAALHLAKEGTAVTVLEANAPGWGASGRNGGFCCLGGAKAPDAMLARRFGRDEADLWFEAQKRAIALVADLLTEHRIEAHTHSDGEVVLAHRPRVYQSFGAEAAWLEARGVGADVLPPDALAERGLAAQGIHGGLHVKIGFGLDPGAYAAGLARAARAAGADIRARSPVTAIRPEKGGHRLVTPGGTLRARRLLIATNGYSSEDLPPWLAGRTLPLQSSVIVTRPLSAAERAAQGWTSDLMAYDSRELLHYFRLMPDGRFLFGMRGGYRATPAAEARIARKIRADFAAMFPAWEGVEIAHEWSGLVNLSRGLTPFVGPVPRMDNAWIAMAYHGNGVAMASYSGALVASLIRGQAPTQPYPSVMQAPLGRFPLGRRRRALFTAATPLLWLRDRL
ncbi:NAD(P)/FAD-dependent oxidoreductase [Sinisalibacter lacisalsi]|uniref:Oxidoreductase n=1 Tax=Sinisalibacter lacisalsi TaxID=1526570 RepID=A0ABQ1QTJ3_9RHOB|nr:FAD-binding oxidoreductase [Sinisalibacter lacisalsi]GGD45451.1 oxidoreductase [Sinisalibacter lacisalsi]